VFIGLVYSGEIQTGDGFLGLDLGTKLLSSVSIPAPPFAVRLRFCPGMTIERLRLCSEKPGDRLSTTRRRMYLVSARRPC
jgi:hypothetical protein